MTSANVGFPGDSGSMPDIFVYIYICRVLLVTKSGQFFFWVTFFTRVGGKQSPYLEGWYKFCALNVCLKVSVSKVLTCPSALLHTCFIDHRSQWWAGCFRAQALKLLISPENGLLTSRPQRCPFYISWLTVCYNQISPLNLICTSEYSLFIPADSWILCWVSALYFLISLHFPRFLKRQQLSCIQAALKGPLLPVRWGRTSEVSALSHASTTGPPTTGRQRGHLFPHRGLASIWNLSISPCPFRARSAKRAPAVWRGQETRGEDKEGKASSSMNLLWFARKQYLNTPTLAIEKPLSGMSPLLSLYFLLLRHGPLLELPSVLFTQTLNNISSVKNTYFSYLRLI